jgi:predicted P-loop ATPase/GTPase
MLITYLWFHKPLIGMWYSYEYRTIMTPDLGILVGKDAKFVIISIDVFI